MIFISNPWGSGEIRGRQVAERLGVPCDPTEKVRMNDTDTIIMVKGFPVNIGADVIRKMPNLWLDVVDQIKCLVWLVDNPNVKAIAISKIGYQYMKNRIENDTVIIPQHHCNFENDVRQEREVRTVGFVGSPGNFNLDVQAVKDALRTIGLDFVWSKSFDNRQDVCNFYLGIDIQLTFRRWTNDMKEPPELKNPLKLENAGSFLIPSVCYPEPNYLDEFDGCFLHAMNLDDVVGQCKRLKNSKSLYDEMAGKAHERAQDYHIDKIVPLYRSLCSEEVT